MGLPTFDMTVSGGSYGQVNKFDTYKVAQLGLNVLSRISRHLLGIINAFIGSPYYNSCQKPYAYFNLEDISAQSPNTTNSNEYTPQPRDLTAYGYNLYLPRGRSFHSSAKYTKGNSLNSSLSPEHDFTPIDTVALNRKKKGSATSMSVDS